jgi:hypothetical protein
MPIITTAPSIGLLASGIFLLIGMLTGIWKYYGMRTSAKHEAAYYINIAHRASLMYANASLILAAFAYLSSYSEIYNVIAILIPLIFFALAIALYCILGFKNTTDNQVKDIDASGKIFMCFLAIGEIGGTAFLVLGASNNLFTGN